MRRWETTIIPLCGMCLMLLANPVAAQQRKAATHVATRPSGRPVTGQELPGWEPLDAAMGEMMDLIGSRAGTLAVASHGKHDTR
jgi:hypothetical protein